MAEILNASDTLRAIADQYDARTKYYAEIRTRLTQEEKAREEGRQEVRDAIIAHMDVYAPHAVDWWKKFNEIIKFDPKGR